MAEKKCYNTAMFAKIRHKRAICFTIALIILLGLASFAVSPGGSEVYDIVSTKKRIEDIRSEAPGSIDVLFAGNSLVFKDISPLQIWDLTGITSYDLSKGAMRLCDQCAMIINACRTQTPKLVVLEANTMFTEASPYKDDFALPTNLIEKILPIFHYHIFYKAWHIFDDGEGLTRLRKGYMPSYGINEYFGSYDYMEEEAEPQEIKRLNREYLDTIADYCRKNDIELLVAAFPSPANYDRETHRAIQDWADEYGVEFVDLNLKLDEVGIDWATDTNDAGDHMNFEGSMKVSEYMADYLKEHYELEDHRDDESYDSWNKDYAESGLYQ